MTTNTPTPISSIPSN